MTAKTWFITGGSSGLGRAFPEHAVHKGHKIAAKARNIVAIGTLSH
jgi:NADP-dependent 3-hydroxy acid dehydrogenase YdfG